MKLLISEDRIFLVTQFTQEMIYVYRVLNYIGLELKLSMIIEVDNQGAVDLKKKWSVGGITCHVEVRKYFIREPKEQGLLLVKVFPGDTNASDLFNKTLGGSDFESCTKVFCNDE